MGQLMKILSSNFIHTFVATEADGVLLFRANVNTQQDYENWRKEFEENTRTCYINGRKIKKTTKFVLSRLLLCQHSSMNKSKSKMSKSTSCLASIDIVIKQATNYTLYMNSIMNHDPPLPAIIKIKPQHNHSITGADALGYLPPTMEMKMRFWDYFDQGSSPAVAIRQHEIKIVVETDSYEALADATKNPKPRTVYNWNDLWRKENFGTVQAPLRALKSRLSAYEKQGAEIIVKDGIPCSVLVITPTMKRAHNLREGTEVVFIDSSSSCDTTSTSVTVISIATKVGAVPIATLLHSDLTEESYTSAFSLLQKNYPNCFGGNNSPQSFMTDDGAAEKNALRNLWPNAGQLLCHFHVAQAEWRWLLDSTNNISAGRRQELMALFRKVMNSDSKVELEESIQRILSQPETNFVMRTENFLIRQKEWVLFHRRGLITRDNNTNNYSEATMRILKDVILERTKAFNAVALVDFFVTVWESYTVNRLLQLAHNRRSSPRLQYEAICKKISSFSVEKVQRPDEHTFTMPSEKNDNIVYTINTITGTCNCTSGSRGGFCKHQCFLTENFNLPFPNSPALTMKDRYEIALLALGQKCPKPEFFIGLREETHQNLELQPFSDLTQKMEVPDSSS